MYSKRSAGFIPNNFSMATLVTEYLALRRGLGFDLHIQGWLLRDFARYADGLGHKGPITIDLVTRWATNSTTRSQIAIAQRLSVVRQFARHRVAYDPATEVPLAGYFRGPCRKPPHIYSDAEIAQLLRAAARLRPRGGLRPRTYVTLFSLLACTGLRVSEARRLTTRDVDLDASLLVIRETKFRKSRLVPLHPSAVKALRQYAVFRDRYANGTRSEYFFRTDHAAALRKRAVETTFNTLRTRLHWTAQGRARRPRIHDLRHTFAVRRLLRWYEEGADVDQKILALSTYLGHAKVTDTYWYLSAIPELLAITARRFEQYARRAGEEIQ
jgi:integrase